MVAHTAQVQIGNVAELGRVGCLGARDGRVRLQASAPVHEIAAAPPTPPSVSDSAAQPPSSSAAEQPVAAQAPSPRTDADLAAQHHAHLRAELDGIHAAHHPVDDSELHEGNDSSKRPHDSDLVVSGLLSQAQQAPHGSAQHGKIPSAADTPADLPQGEGSGSRGPTSQLQDELSGRSGAAPLAHSTPSAAASGDTGAGSRDSQVGLTTLSLLNFAS